MNEHQKRVWEYLKKNGSQTKEQIFVISGKNYYCNWGKHFGDFLSRMVEAGYIYRVRQGIYAAHLVPRQRVKRYEVSDCQINIFGNDDNIYSHLG